MKARVTEDLNHMFDGTSISKGEVVKVELYYSDSLYIIVEPEEYREKTLSKKFLEFLPDETAAYGTDCRGGCDT